MSLLSSLLGRTQAHVPSPHYGIEDIRSAIHASLGHEGGLDFPQVVRRVQYAMDVQGLWYLRGEVMQALAAMRGELIAQQMMNQITPMFEGLLPPSLVASAAAQRR